VSNSEDTIRADGGAPIHIGVSSCLLGQKVRYDGGHKYYSWLVENLGPHVEFRPVCPETAIGLGVPRPPIHLVQRDDGVHAVGVDAPRQDVSERLREYAELVADEIGDFAGYVFKRGSPSCGLARVPIATDRGEPAGEGAGLFASVIRQRWPNLPMEEESGLEDPARRARFLVNVFTYHRWQERRRKGMNAASLVDFHTRNKFLVLAHDESRYRKLGPMVAQAGTTDPEELARCYESEFMAALRHPATAGQHGNVLMHLLGMVKDLLAPADKQTLLRAIEDLRRGTTSLQAVQGLLTPWLRKDARAWRAAELYLQPFPADLLEMDC
jgi:uncharacterized protein YbgA (DUF1722 family)/uncharacterized protein YbbK (DUF523 family)